MIAVMDRIVNLKGARSNLSDFFVQTFEFLLSKENPYFCSNPWGILQLKYVMFRRNW